MASVQDLINENNGHFLTVTGGDAQQCTAVAHRWQQMLGLPIVYGNAIDVFGNAPDSEYAKVANAAENFPVEGDIIIWHQDPRAGTGAYGHIAVVVTADANSFTVFEQNDTIGGGNGSCREWHFHNYAGVTGWLHPHVLDVPVVVEPASILPPAIPVQSATSPTEAPIVAQDTPPTIEVAQTPSGTGETIVEPMPGDVVLPQTTTASDATIAAVTEVTKVNKLKSRKLWVTIGSVASAILLYTSHAISAGASLTSITFLSGLYVAVQGVIDHATASN